MSLDSKKQSNPFSTGGGGVNFETRVQASFAIALLTQSCVPCLSQNMRPQELKFQNKYDGSNTDDFVLVASDKLGNKSKLYAQIKHEITISGSIGSDENSSIFSDVIKSAWEDFQKDSFDKKNDAIALITGPLPKLDIANTLPLLEWARYSSSASDFIKKSNTTGFTSAAKLKKLEALRKQLDHANGGQAITDEQFWEFLRVFYLVSFDLDAKHSVVAHLLCSLIQCHSNESPELILSKVIMCVQEYNQNAGTLTLENIPQLVRDLFQVNIKVNFEMDFLKLQERGRHIYDGISNKIQGFHVSRDDYLLEISVAFDTSDFVFVTGSRGSGKSGIVKDFISSKGKDVPVFYLRAEDLDRTHLNDVFSSIGMNSTLGQIEGYFSLLPKKILVIESIEKILELDHQEAFIDLLQFIRQQEGWTIIATGRDYAFQLLCFNFLQQNQINFTSVNIEGFSEEQMQLVCEHIPELKTLISNDALVEILRIPFFIDIAVRAISNGAQFQTGDTEIDFRKNVWSSVIAKDQDRKYGMPLKRRKTFIDIATQRAKKMVFGISADQFDPEVISKLEEDNLIYRDPNNSTISLPHDVLEDWALEEFIEEKYQYNIDNLDGFLSAIGNEPAISRAFRLWLYRRLQFDESSYEFVENLLITDNIESFWKDETIAAILQHNSPDIFLQSMKDNLLKNDCALLIRFCFILRITCQKPNSSFVDLLTLDKKSGILQTLFLVPYGKGWGALFNFIYEVRNELSKSIHNHIIELMNEWCSVINIDDDLPTESRIVGLLSLWLLEPLKDDYQNKSGRKKIISVLLKVSPTIEAEFDQLMVQDVFISKVNPRRLSYVDQLTNLTLVGIHVPMLCKFRPDFIMKLAMHEWVLEQKRTDNWPRYERISGDERYGLDENRDFFAPSSAKGPFQYLLQYHPKKALDFILELCNFTTEKYIEYLRKEGHEIYLEKLVLDDGTSIDQFVSTEFWSGYRGHSNIPYVLQCALMALENWLISYVEHSGENNQIDWIYNYLLKNSKSVLITAILASVAIGFSDKVRKSVFPILSIAEFYLIDISRFVHEAGENQLHWFNAYNNDVMTDIYIEERKKSALRPWRKETLETLLNKLQFSDLREDVLPIVDNLKKQASTSDDTYVRYLANRIDTREWQVIEDKENNRILFQNASELPEDLKQDQQTFIEQHDFDNAIIGLNLWARELFEKKQFKKEYFSSYEAGLEAAKQLLTDLQSNPVSNYLELAVEAIKTVAVVCIRDNIQDLSSVDIEWCLEIIVSSVIESPDNLEVEFRYNQSHFGNGACAYILPKLFELKLEPEISNNLKFALATALTHGNHNIGALTAKGVRDYLWSIDEELAENCLNGVIEYAKFRIQEQESSRFYYLKDKEREVAQKKWEIKLRQFRQQLLEGTFSFSVDDISLENHASWLLHIPMLMIPMNPKNSKQGDLILKLVNFIFDSEYRDYHSRNEDKMNHEIKWQIQSCFTEQLIHSKINGFVLFKDLIISGCLKAPSIIYSVKLSFDVAAEKENDFDAIWSLWKIIEPELHKIAINDVNDPYQGLQNDLNKLLRGELYADTPWQGHESERKCMEKGVEHLLEFAKQSSNNSHVFMALSSLIYHFYDLFFDKGIQILAEKFRANSGLITKQVNTAFYLEMSIARYLQVENRGILSRKMYQICLVLLTGLVETGSARAYYLREHLVRSRKITA
ncbi:hypothetical protein [Acinetobacter sp. ANC 4648]|uniref:hypothetical protein n=1 Tax=Acinetobacter sp. ANC 4648 TaxID=1977875 RepID=UPI000A34EC0A|nr:hypothetical protein [Acinetobacter sp. ANC 4648]OTG82322.1 hypothetical protein B9T27_08790 [Acinetobacter sp. ANC 4648]